jgi:hypothetical protein
MELEDAAVACRYTDGVNHRARLAPDDRAARDQRNTEALVRRLLRRSADSYRLAAFPLAQALCRATGIANAQLALRHVVEAAFQNAPHEAHLRELILSDLDAHLSRTESAAQLQVSRRHLQRYRAQAVSILARHIREVVRPVAFATDDGESLADPLDVLAEMIARFEPATAAKLCRLGSPESASRAGVLEIRSHVEAGNELREAPDAARLQASRSLLAVLQAQSKQINGKEREAKEALRPVLLDRDRDLAYDSEALFELEWLTFLRARHRGDAAEMHRTATSLLRIAQDRSLWRSRALLALAESQIRLGRITNALNTLDAAERLNLQTSAIGQLASTTALRAEVALVRGDDTMAERLASGAYVVLQGRHYDSFGCLATIARARLRLNKPWTCGESLEPLGQDAWDRVRVDVECARHLRDDGFLERAGTAAAQAYRASVHSGFEGLAARAAASAGAIFDESSLSRREWYLRALSHLLATRDHFIAVDLFAPTSDRVDERPLGSFDEDAAGAVYSGLARAIPQLGMEPNGDGAAARVYLKHLGQYVAGMVESPKRLRQAADVLGDDSRAFVQFVLRFTDDVADIVRPAFLAIVNGRHRFDVDTRLQEALTDFAARVRPAGERQFLVG